VDLVVGNSEKSTLIERIVDAMRINDIVGAPYMAPSGVMNPAPTGPVHKDPWLGGISRFEGHRRAFLKVQDGCDFGCSFCLIPRVRGTMVSRPAADILAEGRRLAEGGVRELVLAGIQLSSYGRDQGLPAGEPRLAPVVEGLLRVPGISRVRLSSYAVADFEDALLPLWREGKGLCAHLHLPLQSGNEGVLRAMRRPYSLEKFRATVAKAREAAPQLGLTSDILAGFPGETEAAFGDTLDLIRELRFLDFHPFPYSDRPGTPGEALTPKTDPRVLKARMGRLLELRTACREAAAREALGWEARVIVERHGEGLQSGLTDEGLRLLFPERAERLGEEARVKVTGFLHGTARAQWVTEPAAGPQPSAVGRGSQMDRRPPTADSRTK
jgi:threonylcarbamoyladenosine tRNA methylthiotransferase MtaB